MEGKVFLKCALSNKFIFLGYIMSFNYDDGNNVIMETWMQAGNTYPIILLTWIWIKPLSMNWVVKILQKWVISNFNMDCNILKYAIFIQEMKKKYQFNKVEWSENGQSHLCSEL